MNRKIIVGTSIGLVVGLVLGILISVFFDLPSAIFPTRAGRSNQVQVSGAVRDTQTGTIYFNSLDGKTRTSAPIIDGKYTILVVGGQSYAISIVPGGREYSLYVPVGVTTFTADF